MDRLLSKTVAAQDEFSTRFPKRRKSPHPLTAVKAQDPVLIYHCCKNLTVGLSGEPATHRCEPFPEFYVVVQLAIHRKPGVSRPNRLVGTIVDVDNRKSTIE